MKKIINGAVCNTATAKLLGSFDNGERPSDLSYVRESLYRTKSGQYFIHGEGGAGTRYARQTEPNHWRSGEALSILSLEAAQKWAEEHLDGDEYIRAFGEPEERTTIMISAATKARLSDIKSIPYSERFSVYYTFILNRWEVKV